MVMPWRSSAMDRNVNESISAASIRIHDVTASAITSLRA
jgi:hypothetical protein